VLVEASTELVNWLPLRTNTFAGPLNFSDPQIGTCPNRFHRAHLPWSADYGPQIGRWPSQEPFSACYWITGCGYISAACKPRTSGTADSASRRRQF